jgi:hypothetical protein
MCSSLSTKYILVRSVAQLQFHFVTTLSLFGTCQIEISCDKCRARNPRRTHSKGLRRGADNQNVHFPSIQDTTTTSEDFPSKSGPGTSCSQIMLETFSRTLRNCVPPSILTSTAAPAPPLPDSNRTRHETHVHRFGHPHLHLRA